MSSVTAVEYFAWLFVLIVGSSFPDDESFGLASIVDH